MSPKLSPDSTPFSRKCIFYQNFDRPLCTMVSIDFVSDSQQIKLYDYENLIRKILPSTSMLNEI